MASEAPQKIVSHKIPVYLEQPDYIVLNLTTRQLLLIGLGISTGYALYLTLAKTHLWWCMVLGLAVGCVLGLLGCVVAFVQPAGRGLETWSIIILIYLCSPKLYLASQTQQIVTVTHAQHREEK